MWNVLIQQTRQARLVCLGWPSEYAHWCFRFAVCLVAGRSSCPCCCVELPAWKFYCHWLHRPTGNISRNACWCLDANTCQVKRKSVKWHVRAGLSFLRSFGRHQSLKSGDGWNMLMFSHFGRTRGNNVMLSTLTGKNSRLSWKSQAGHQQTTLYLWPAPVVFTAIQSQF